MSDNPHSKFARCKKLNLKRVNQYGKAYGKQTSMEPRSQRVKSPSLPKTIKSYIYISYCFHIQPQNPRRDVFVLFSFKLLTF